MVTIPPGSALGRYRIVEQLGRGGMATVFRCHDPNLDRFVAVKVLPSYYTEDPTFLGRFTQEAQAIARLNHPNILQIYDFGDDKGYTYIVSELVPGGTLQDRLIGEPMSVEQVISYMAPLSEAIDFAHASQVVHRDIKPGNVLINDSEQPILADFGLARMMESSTRFTQAQQAVGTPEYMAPEQALGTDADYRADLYSLGIIVYQMLVGQTPFQSDTPAATLMAHIHRALPMPRLMNPNIDETVEMVLLKALAKDPDDRFQSATEMVQALETAAGITVTAVRAVPPPPRPAASPAGAATPAAQSSGLPKWILAAGVAVVMVLIAAAASFFLLGGDETTPAVAQAPAAAAPAPITASSDGVSPALGNRGAETGAASVPIAASGDPCASLESTATASAGNVAQSISQLQAMQTDTQTAVEQLRGITNPPPVQTTFRTRRQLCEITLGFYRRRDVRDQIFEAEELYKTLGVISEDHNLEQTLLNIQLQQVSALVDDVSGDVYVLSDASEITPQLERSYAAAYMGGLQQALFDVTALRDDARADTGDRFRATTALISGDVGVIIGGYVDTVIAQNPDALAELQLPQSDNLLQTAPPIIRKTVLFPLNQGQDFVRFLYDHGAWREVDDAYDDPPVSSEQVLHPKRYISGELPDSVAFPPDFADTMSRGWSLTAIDTMGEFLLRSYLEEHLTESAAAAAADGWGGDQYVLMSHPEQGRLLLAMFVFDAVEETTEFIQSFEAFMASATADANARSERIGPAGQRWLYEDGRTVFLGESSPGVLLIIGDELDAVGEALQKFAEAQQNNSGNSQARRPAAPANHPFTTGGRN